MRFVLLVFVCLMSLPCSSQKAFKGVKSALKAKKFNDAVEQVERLRKDSTYTSNPKLCLWKIEACRGLNDAENTKLYLKKNYDTLSFFSTTRQIIEEAVKLDSIEGSETSEAQRYCYKHYDFVANLLRQYYPNLNAGARFFYTKTKYPQAMEYLRLCIDLPNTPLGHKVDLPEKWQSANAAAYLTAAYLTKNYLEVFRYRDVALQNMRTRVSMWEYMAFSAKEMNDTAQYRHYLEMGWQEKPEYTTFFAHLADYYKNRGDYATLLTWAKKQNAITQSHSPALLAEVLAYFNLQQYDSCIVASNKLLQSDTSNVEAHYYIGASYIAKGDLVQFPQNTTVGSAYRKSLQARNDYYKQAEPALETYRKLKPEAKDMWGSPLYKIYLALNRGKKFAEIEKLLAQ